MVPLCIYSTTWDYFGNISRFIWTCRYFSLSLGFWFFLFLFSPLIPDTPGHISETVSWIKTYILSWYLLGICILVDLQKDHIGVLLINILTIDFHGVLLICVIPMVWGEEEFKNWKFNISANIYPRKNTKVLLRQIILS